ncbi:MAG TPA: universal stress protein [Candidatus Acidoferrum sp.]|nr:universal stress protein [Candidatus Acidoferrum sp.]
MLKTDKSLESKLAPESKLVKLEKILVATDFSGASERALEYALSLARRYESQICLVHVITSDADVLLAPELMATRHEKAVRDAQERMGQVLISGRLRGVPHEMLIEHGALWPTMQALIEKEQINLVVAGTSGIGSLQKVLIGSGAEEIFRQAKCPVLTVGPAIERETPREVEFKNILFATDFGVGAERQSVYAFSLAQEHQANLTLLHVIKHAEDYSEQGLALKKNAIIHELGELAPAGGELWCNPVFRMRLGEPVEAILEMAREMKADLIVIGAKRGKGLALGHAPRTVAYRVVCGAPCPVLTVRS